MQTTIVMILTIFLCVMSPLCDVYIQLKEKETPVNNPCMPVAAKNIYTILEISFWPGQVNMSVMSYSEVSLKEGHDF